MNDAPMLRLLALLLMLFAFGEAEDVSPEYDPEDQ